MSDIKPFDVQRPWGSFRQFNLNSPITVKVLTVNANEELSLQSHEKRAEFWRVLKGGGVMIIDDKEYNVSEGHEQNIPLGIKHKIIAGPSGMQLLELAVGDFLEEKDETRYEDKYGRV